MWEEWIEAWWNTWMNRQCICVYMDLCVSLESNICMANLAHRHLSLFQMKWGPICVQHFWCRKIREILCRVPREWVKSKFLWQDAYVMSLSDKCIVVGFFVWQNSHGDGKVLWQHQGHWKCTRVWCWQSAFSRRILRFKTSATDLIYSERVSTSTSSFFSHRLAYSSHAAMRTITTGVICWQRMLTPLDTWSCPIRDQSSLMFRPVGPS